MSNQSDRWLSIREAALELGTSELTIRRRIKAGRLRSRLQAGKYFVCLDGSEPVSEAPSHVPANDVEQEKIDLPSETEPASEGEPVIRAGDLLTLIADRTELAEAAGRAELLQQQLQALEERYATLQEGALALSNRNGWLESKLEEREREIKLLTDSQHRVSWWRRVFLGG